MILAPNDQPNTVITDMPTMACNNDNCIFFKIWTLILCLHSGSFKMCKIKCARNRLLGSLAYANHNFFSTCIIEIGLFLK